MIITRTPLRISLGGGGTDLPSYYEKFGGFVMSATISKYIYISLHRTFRENYIIKYSSLEEVEDVSKITHPIVREAFRLHDVQPFIEMVSQADIPAGTGLGSSGAFTIGLLRAIYCLKREYISTQGLAEEACHIEIDLLKEPIGKQDQYIAAFGGMSCMEISKSGQVNITALRIPSAALHDLEDNLLLFFTGYSRSASALLADQKGKTNENNSAMIENLHFIKELGLKTKAALISGDTYVFAQLMHEHWLTKKKRSSAISNDKINRWYDVGISNGALGGKLIGAGGGGFMMFYAKDRSSLREAMFKEGLPEVRFNFDFEGSKILVEDS